MARVHGYLLTCLCCGLEALCCFAAQHVCGCNFSWRKKNLQHQDSCPHQPGPEWAIICHIEEDAVTLSYLTFEFLLLHWLSIPWPEATVMTWLLTSSRNLGKGPCWALLTDPRPLFHPWINQSPPHQTQERFPGQTLHSGSVLASTSDN